MNAPDQEDSREQSSRRTRDETLIVSAICAASRDELTQALRGTVGDALTYCRAALRQYSRRSVPLDHSDGFGQHFAEAHILLIVAHEAVCHAARVEQLLQALEDDRRFPPSETMRDRLRVARNLLAEHRDERVLYWRLRGEHTPRVRRDYERLGVELPSGSIDSERFDHRSQVGDGWGTVGELLSLPDLKDDLETLAADLDQLSDELRAPQPVEEDRASEGVTITLQIVGPITVRTS
jgi:hypothetical protein